MSLKTDNFDGEPGCIRVLRLRPAKHVSMAKLQQIYKHLQTLGDACVDAECVFTEWSTTVECNPPLPCTEDVVVNCTQENAIDDDGCCCYAADPTGAHKSGQVLDLGLIDAGTEIAGLGLSRSGAGALLRQDRARF